MLLMDCLGNKTSIRSEHESSHLGIDGNIAHSCRNKHFIVCFMNALTDHTDIVRLLIRCVRNSDTAGEINETDIASGLVAQLNNELKQLSCELRIILVRYGIACKESVDSEMFRTFAFKNLICFNDLILGHSVLGISRVVHDSVTQFKHSARIVATADSLRNMADRLL